MIGSLALSKAKTKEPGKTPRIGKHFNLAGKGGRRIYVQQKSGAAPQREDEDGAVRLRVDEEVAVGDGDAAVGAVGEVPRVEVELDERRLVPTAPLRRREHPSSLSS